jgi:hypothetical protein
MQIILVREHLTNMQVEKEDFLRNLENKNKKYPLILVQK